MRATTVALITLLAVAPAAISYAAPAREFHKVVPLDANGRISVDSHNGSVNVTAWNQPNVGVDASIEPGDFGAEAEDVAKTNIRVTGGGSSVDIASDYSAVGTHISWFGVSRTLPLVHYTIHVPASAMLKVEVHNASIKVSGVHNDVSLHTHNGAIDVTDLDGAARVETHNGSVRVVFANMTRPSRIETHNGSVDVNVPATTRMTVSVDGHRSDPFSSDLPMNVKASGSSYSAAINGGGPELRFVTHNGSLHLRKR
jgi:hypothetical protein